MSRQFLCRLEFLQDPTDHSQYTSCPFLFEFGLCRLLAANYCTPSLLLVSYISDYKKHVNRNLFINQIATIAIKSVDY